MKNELTLVIPCKNEEGYIGHLLNSIRSQIGIDGVRIIIADAGSTDGTLEIINSFKSKLNIEVISGGLPALARNRGLSLSKTEFTLFIDADVTIDDITLIHSALDKIKSKGSKILTCKLNSNTLIVKILYKLTNMFIYLSKFDKPFVPGTFTMVRTKEAQDIGGFPEWAMHCEDYLLSSKFHSGDFTILDKYVWTDDRRFKKMKWWRMVFYFTKNIIMRNKSDYFKKDINYWL